jgi:hypothetical protein
MLNVVWSRLTGEKRDAMTTHHHAYSARPLLTGETFEVIFTSTALGNFFIDFKLVPQEGFEPPTPSLRITISGFC